MAKIGNPPGGGGKPKKKKGRQSGTNPEPAPKAGPAKSKDGTEVEVQGSGPMVTTPSTTAPASAADDPNADQSDQDLQAFFSSGTGPAMHYDLQQQQAAAEPATASAQ